MICLVAISQPLSSAPPGPVRCVCEESSRDGRMEVIPEPKAKVSRLLGSHAASKKPVPSPQHGAPSQGDHHLGAS